MPTWSTDHLSTGEGVWNTHDLVNDTFVDHTAKVAGGNAYCNVATALDSFCTSGASVVLGCWDTLSCHVPRIEDVRRD